MTTLTFADMPDDKLKKVVRDMNEQVFYSECIGPNDYHNLIGAVKALEARGYKITGERKLAFKK